MSQLKQASGNTGKEPKLHRPQMEGKKNGVFLWKCFPILPVEHFEVSGVESPFQLIPKLFDGVEVRAVCGPVKFFHTKLNQPCIWKFKKKFFLKK